MAKTEEFAKSWMDSYSVISFYEVNLGKEVCVLNECAGRPHVFHFEMFWIEVIIQSGQVENESTATVGFGQHKERG